MPNIYGRLAYLTDFKNWHVCLHVYRLSFWWVSTVLLHTYVGRHKRSSYKL